MGQRLERASHPTLERDTSRRRRLKCYPSHGSLIRFARATVPIAQSQSPLYSSLILPFDLSFTQRKRVLSLATSVGRFRRTFGVHLHDLLRLLEGPCKPEYGNHPSLVFNPDGSSFLVSHSSKGCLHVRTEDRDPSSNPIARLSLYSNTTLEDIISIDYTPLSETTPPHDPAITPPVRALSLDAIVQRAPIIAGYSATQRTVRDADRQLEDDLEAFVRWHIPLNRDPVLVSPNQREPGVLYRSEVQGKLASHSWKQWPVCKCGFGWITCRRRQRGAFVV